MELIIKKVNVEMHKTAMNKKNVTVNEENNTHSLHFCIPLRFKAKLSSFTNKFTMQVNNKQSKSVLIQFFP